MIVLTRQIPCLVLRTLVNEGRLTPDATGVVDLAQLDHALDNGRVGMEKALNSDVTLDMSSSKGLQAALCPAGMRPATKPQPVSPTELQAVHTPSA